MLTYEVVGSLVGYLIVRLDVFPIDLVLFTSIDSWQKGFLTPLHRCRLEPIVGIGCLFVGNHVREHFRERHLDKVRD
jgi:hypothetical protein